MDTPGFTDAGSSEPSSLGFGEKVDNYRVDNKSPGLKLLQNTGLMNPSEPGAYMKNMQNFTSRLVVFGIAFVAMAWLSAASAQMVNQDAAKVVRVVGAVRYTADNANWLPLKKGDMVHPGAIIQTASSSQVDILLSGRGLVRLYENTVLGVDKLARMETGADLVTETLLDVRKGKITGNVKHLSGASKYEVKFKNGVAGIRGTTYTISENGVVSVLDGSVVVGWVRPDGTVATQVVNAGEMFDPAGGVITSITPVEQAEMQDLKKVSEGVVGGGAAKGSEAPDHTVEYVSPK
jgi:hypothetical protein